MALLYSHALSHFKTVFAVPPIVELLNLAVILPLMYAALSLQEQEHAALINAIQEMSFVVEHGLALRAILVAPLTIPVWHQRTIVVLPLAETHSLAVEMRRILVARSLQEQEHAALINAIQEMSYVVEHGLALRVILAVQLPIPVKLHFHHAHSDPLFVEGNIAFHQPPPAAIQLMARSHLLMAISTAHPGTRAAVIVVCHLTMIASIRLTVTLITDALLDFLYMELPAFLILFHGAQTILTYAQKACVFKAADLLLTHASPLHQPHRAPVLFLAVEVVALTHFTLVCQLLIIVKATLIFLMISSVMPAQNARP